MAVLWFFSLLTLNMPDALGALTPAVSPLMLLLLFPPMLAAAAAVVDADADAGSSAAHAVPDSQDHYGKA